jgi:hypothetical protein
MGGGAIEPACEGVPVRPVDLARAEAADPLGSLVEEMIVGALPRVGFLISHAARVLLWP